MKKLLLILFPIMLYACGVSCGGGGGCFGGPPIKSTNPPTNNYKDPSVNPELNRRYGFDSASLNL